jgi:hypothetical protein
MKVLIEIDLPEGQRAPTPEEILRLTSPDWVADWWHVSDVQEQYAGDGEYYDLSIEDCRRVLEIMSNNKDANIGFNWDYVAECTEEITGG